jgi:L-fuconolactonase
VRIDAHQHYWRFDPVRDSWITPEMAVLRRDFFPDDAAPLLAAAGIDAVVAVQADQSVAETDFLLALAAQQSFIRGVVGWINLRAPDLSEQLARWRGNPLLKGFRHIAQGEPDDFLVRNDVVAGIAELGRQGFSYDILIYPRQLAAAEQLVARCPGVRFVLDHCAKPPIASGDISEWRRGIRRLARHENIACKLSGLVTEASWTGWTAIELTASLDTAAEAFGPGRLMFGSDWPVCLLAADYTGVVSVVDDWAERLTASEQASIFGGTAMSAYHLESRDGS